MEVLDADQVNKKPGRRWVFWSLGSFFLLITCLGYIFRVMHWPGAGVMIIGGGGLLCGLLLGKIVRTKGYLFYKLAGGLIIFSVTFLNYFFIGFPLSTLKVSLIAAGISFVPFLFIKKT